MTTYLPISSPFIRFAGRYVDDAFGVAAGWNFFIFEAALVPFEIVACNVIIHFWSDVVPAGGIIAITIVLYAYVCSSISHHSLLEFTNSICLQGYQSLGSQMVSKSIRPHFHVIC